MRDLPSGTVTFLFTDVEGSTRLVHELGADGYAGALAEHRRVLRAEHLPIARDHSRLDLSTAFARVAYVLARAGRIAGAARILSYSEALTEEIGANEPWVVELNDQTRAIVREQLGEAAFAEAYEQGRTLATDDAIEVSLEIPGSTR